MRLYLALAVLLLALVAYTEAQDDTMQQKFANVGDQLSEFGQTIAEKTKTAFQTIQDSDFAVATRDFFKNGFEKLKKQMQDISNP
ncbi:apolipoprotein C-I [Nerophis lumbriciformis]|uniref:apolipoprotein C-I n=1 Tax=Nerophis lumbriciformis TaxID=546530 RepID=UPI002AE02510|nr:apolipoprotein C-I-like [Nerophis lumbriciformis]